MRILFRNYNVSDVTKQQLLYGVAVLICIVSLLGIITFLSYFSDDPTAETIPSPSPGALSTFLQRNPQAQVAGAQTQNRQQLLSNQELGPKLPSPQPSPSSSPSPSPSASPSPTPSSSPSPSPTPSQTPTPTPTPTQTPTPTPTTTPTPIPQAPTNLDGDPSCPEGKPKVNLTWNASSGATSYKVYRNGSIISSGSLNTFYTDSQVTEAASYLYFVRALNSTGESADSNSVNITPSCP